MLFVLQKSSLNIKWSAYRCIDLSPISAWQFRSLPAIVWTNGVAGDHLKILEELHRYEASAVVDHDVATNVFNLAKCSLKGGLDRPAHGGLTQAWWNGSCTYRKDNKRLLIKPRDAFNFSNLHFKDNTHYGQSFPHLYTLLMRPNKAEAVRTKFEYCEESIPFNIHSAECIFGPPNSGHHSLPWLMGAGKWA